MAITDCLQTSLNDLTSKLSRKEVEYSQLHHQHLSTMSEQHSLELRIQELESALKLAR